MKQREFYQEDASPIQKGDVIAIIDEMTDSVPASTDEYIDTLNTLWKARKRSGWGVGAMLARLEGRLKADYERWIAENKSRAEFKRLMGDNAEADIPIKSLSEWFERFGDRVDLSYPQARLCIGLFEGTTREIGEELGTKKFAVVRALPEPVREKLIVEAVKNDWTTDELKDRAEEARGKITQRETEKVEREKEAKKIERTITIDIVIEDKRLKKNELLIQCGSEEERDLFNEALYMVMDRIKARIYSQK